MKISEIIADKYSWRLPPTVYYDLLADLQEAEEEQEPSSSEKPNKSEIPTSSDDCISRQAVLDLINADWKYENLEIEINNLPSVTPVRLKGHWIEEFNDIEGEVRFTCSNCKKYQLFGTDFCYNCGSDNRKVEECQEKN